MQKPEIFMWEVQACQGGNPRLCRQPSKRNTLTSKSLWKIVGEKGSQAGSEMRFPHSQQPRWKRGSEAQKASAQWALLPAPSC